MSLTDRITKALNSKEVKKLEKIADRIEALDEEMQSLSDEQLREKTQEFKARLYVGETMDDILPEAYAVCREAAWRSLGQKHFRVQLIGGIVLHQGRIAEMKTGEGKTLAATLPVYLNALGGEGVHVVTVNDYLAARDAEWMGKLYNFLGMTVGCITNDVEGSDRHEQYMADVTYGTNNEFGFDYLRDNMAIYKEDIVQRGLNYAIIDEVDSILIDEARTPLIISGRAVDTGALYRSANAFVKTLVVDEDYKIDEKEKQVALTETGVDRCEMFFGIENFSDPDNMEINHYVHQALRANYIMHRDVDYVVRDGEVLIVDEYTGRIMYGRRFSNGLHQAIEAKERVRVQAEDRTMATITLQNYFRMYSKLAGMTGTAKTEEEEFRDIYNMDVVVVPTNKPVKRVDKEDIIFVHKKEKYDAVSDAVADIHSSGRPVLVGTVSVEVSEQLSRKLKKKGIRHNILNAKNHEHEAEIVADAGRLGAVTIATNMAGRGTDIMLGGNSEFEAKRQMRRAGYTAEQISFATGLQDSDDTELMEARKAYNEFYISAKKRKDEEEKAVVALGGLVIIGTERHESRRIDNQLRGRSGRQGDPGETRFYISLEDDLVRLHGGEKINAILYNTGSEKTAPIDSSRLLRTIEKAQKKVEDRNFYIRKYVLQYDNVMNKQREIIYKQRRKALYGEDLSEQIQSMAQELFSEIVDSTVSASKFPEEWDLDRMRDELDRIVPGTGEHLKISTGEIRDLEPRRLKDMTMAVADGLYKEKEIEIGSNQIREMERVILLHSVDSHWIDHIDAMEQLEDGIGLRSLGQQDPANAYAKEGFEMFEEMVTDIKRETVSCCFKATVLTSSKRKNRVLGKTKALKNNFDEKDFIRPINGDEPYDDYCEGVFSDFDESYELNQNVTLRHDTPKIGRNDPCPCGSGKKYKNCCGRK